MNPTFVIASQDVDKDTPLLSRIFEELQKDANYEDILEIIQVNLKQSGCGAKIRLYKDKPFFIRWWKWILK